ncbi:MAG TPA: response regulator [Kofleriaceae bacterium]|nr:response regulator [Kofleriaceae bacterium]
MKGQVLIVDDDAAIREVLSLILTAEGYRVEAAKSGIEALSHLTGGHRPCLMLLDLRMPEMDGWELRRAQLEVPEWASIPVVVLSGDRDAREVAEAMNAQGYLLKPVELDDVLSIVRQYC